MTLWLVATAFADHGGAPGPAPMSPYLYGLVWGAGVLIIGLVVAIVVNKFPRRRPR